MSNSTARTIVNRMLIQAGQAEIGSDNDFNDNTALDKPQVQAKYFNDLINRRMVLSCRGCRFLEREFSLSITSSGNSYSIDSTVMAETLVEDSWYISTADAGVAPLVYLPYTRWKQQFPEGESTTGEPARWIILPPDGSNIDKVSFSPPPGASYTVKYRGYLRPTSLLTATTTVAWPADYEHVLILAGQTFLEMVLSEGKMQDVGQFMEPWISELKQLSQGAPDDPPKADLGIKWCFAPKRGRRYVRTSS